MASLRQEGLGADSNQSLKPDVSASNQHFLLSPLPSSQAPASSQSKSGVSNAGITSTTSDKISSVTLYPLEPVPSHLLCAICTLPYENPVHFLPCCHVFCLECIQLWIGMNLNDDLLQSELRRAFPAEDEDLNHTATSFTQENEPLVYELSRMGGDPRSRIGTSSSEFYDILSEPTHMSHIPSQQRVAILLENREMPKCPMCRTALHIHTWDRIEEQIKVPISLGHRPYPPQQQHHYQQQTGLSRTSNWLERTPTHGQRPVSGVERRRLRSDRLLLGNTQRDRDLGRQDSIGEQVEEDEEIEMEHVGPHRSQQGLSSSHSSINPRQHPRSRRETYSTPMQSHQSLSSRPIYPNDLHALNSAGDDLDLEPDELQSPTTAVIGRRPSEWMRYQQRQLQAHQAQLQQQASRSQSQQWGDSTFEDFNIRRRRSAERRYDEQQEQIRRLYLEQESQEELLRTLTARAASILEAGSDFQRQTPPNTALSSSIHSLSTTQSGGTPENNERADFSGLDSDTHTQQNSQLRRSMLHVDTNVTRPNTRPSRDERPRQTNRVVNSPRLGSPETAVHITQRSTADGLPASTDIDGQNIGHSQDENEVEEANQDRQESRGDDNNTMFDELQQGTRAWAQRPSSVHLDLEESEQSHVLSHEDPHGQVNEETRRSPYPAATESAVRSSLTLSMTSSSTDSSGIQSSTVALSSPTNTNSFSYRTSSTYSHSHSHSRMTRLSSDSPFSQQSPTNQWEQPLALMIPTLDTNELHLEGLDPEVSGLITSGRLSLESTNGGEAGDNLEHLWRGTTEGRVPPPPPPPPNGSSSTAKGEVCNDRATVLQTIDEKIEESTLTTSSGTEPEPESSQPTEPLHFLQCKSAASSSSAAGSSLLLRDLDIHSPIVTTAEGSVTTIADMQIDADILARARSRSTILSDEDDDLTLPATALLPRRRHRSQSSSVSSSPIDSPIPTPSTARPRQRFPAGISLEEDADDLAEEERETEEILVFEQNLSQDEAAPHEHDSNDQRSLVSLPRDDFQATPATAATPEDVGAELHQEAVADPLSSPQDAQELQDPLSATLTTDEAIGGRMTRDNIPQQAILEIANVAEPLNSRMASPPPLPLPLDSAGEFAEVSSHDPVLASELTWAAATQVQLQQNIRSRPTSHISLSSNSGSQGRQSTQGQSARPSDGLMTSTSRPSSSFGQPSALHQDVPLTISEPRVDDNGDDEETPNPWPTSSSRSMSSVSSNSPSGSLSSGPTGRVEEHVQYRTLVRYQPRLPKAHVMSDLISQTRVQCPESEHGCREVLEMQLMPQHWRQKCHFRPVMCPRARCGLWMRADQIVEHILLVEQSAQINSTRSDSLLLNTSTPSSSLRSANNKPMSRRLNRKPPRGQSGSESKDEPRTSTNISNSAASSCSSSSVQPCPGLTWEREQLTRATGIIGQLTEENTSLRQMIRQLTLQNSKLTKEKDRFQRYANLGLGRDK
ncbi:hypothetical protein BG004_006606 [Podila humilis]|nr:hypothetical protein BG004_006606 [Podila humilis]